MRLLTVPEVCEILSCKASYVYFLVQTKKIPHLKLGFRTLRFPEDKLLKWIEDQENGGAS